MRRDCGPRYSGHRRTERKTAVRSGKRGGRPSCRRSRRQSAAGLVRAGRSRFPYRRRNGGGCSFPGSCGARTGGRPRPLPLDRARRPRQSRPDASGMGRNGENDRAGDRLREALASVDGKPALLCPDGVTPASWQALSRTALCAAVHDLRIVMDTLPGRGLNFLPGEEADSTGLLTLAGAAAGRRLRWGRPEDDGWDRVDKATPVTTDWSKAASLLWGGAETVLLVNSLPSAAFFSNNPDLCDSCRLLLRMPGLAGF